MKQVILPSTKENSLATPSLKKDISSLPIQEVPKKFETFPPPS